MRRVVKVKALATQVPLRKALVSAPAASRRGFPAWIEADEGVAAFPTRPAATPRVRDGLVLRKVSKKKSSSVKNPRHGNRAR